MYFDGSKLIDVSVKPMAKHDEFPSDVVKGCVWKLVSNFVSPKTALGNSHLEVQKTQNTFKKAFA